MGRVFASGDWHGCGGPAFAALNWLSADATLYFVGDAIDRGSDGIAIMKRLFEDKRIIYLRGNHEQMMFDAIPSILNAQNDDSYYHWCMNGGNKTVQTFQNMSENEILDFRKAIKKLPVEKKYISPKGHTVILEHAGYTPGMTRGYDHDPLWDRSHFMEEWWEEEHPNLYLVHGHTPVPYLQFVWGYKDQPPMTKEDLKYKKNWHKENSNYIPKVIQYCNGHKFDIDMCTITTDVIALLDLDTFEVIYFNEKGVIE